MRAPMQSFDRDFDRQWRRTGRWFAVWFTVCALVGLAALVGLGWLLFAVVDWLGRH